VTSPAERLLRELDGLAFPERLRAVAAVARRLAGSAELDGLLAELDGRAEFARRVALQVAVVARHRGYVERCLAAPEPAVARAALTAAIRLGGCDAAVLALLPRWPAALRRAVYPAVRRHRAAELAEALLPQVRARYGDDEAAVLLPACSASTVAGALPELGYAVRNWGPFGRRYPGVLLDHLAAELDAAPRSGWRALWLRMGTGVEAAAATEPDRVLALLERSAPHAPLTVLGRRVGPVARQDPSRLLRLLLDPLRTDRVPGGRALWRALLGAPDADLLRLARADPGQLVQLLHVLPAARRPAIYAGALGEQDLAGTGVPVAVLDELPVAARTAEARRLLGLRSVADDPGRRLAITARLPWVEARPVLAEATRQPVADDRAAAYQLYIRAAAARRDPGEFGAMLRTLTRLANEQAPVRAAALGALAVVPAWLFRPEEMPVLSRLMTDALEARDSSWMTHLTLRNLSSRLICEGALSGRPALVDCGLSTVGRLSGHVNWIDLVGLDRALPRGAEVAVFGALRPRIVADARRGRFSIALALAAGLGRRAWGLPELQQHVAAAQAARDDATVRWAIELWLRPPSTRDDRVARVLRADRSTITLWAVQQAVGWRRTDLLDDVFSRPMHGRFLKRGVRYVPLFAGCFDRWLPRQVAAYTRLLTDLATATGLPMVERAAAVRRLGRVPGTADLLRRWLDSPQVPLVEAALAALAWTDEPAAALPVLLSYADTDRARVAVYAAVRCARFVQPEQLSEQLRPVLIRSKVTSRKEAARLLAEFRAPGAAAILAEAWAAPGQHRDVRRALVSAARWCLDDEPAWQPLATAATAEQAVATALLDLRPDAIADRHRPRYAELVRTVAASVDADTARLGLAALPQWARWDGGSAAMLVDRIGDLAATATWRPALDALIAGCESTAEGEPLRAAATRLLGTADPFDAAPDRDRPARQRLVALAGATAAAAGRSAALRDTAETLAGVLAADPASRPLAVDLAVAAVQWGPDGREVDQLRLLAGLADRALLAARAAAKLRQALGPLVGRLPPERMLTAAQALAGNGARPATQPAALLALTLAGRGGPAAGWPEAWRGLVRALRRHPDPDVRQAALEIVTSPE
jgi:hypothetical protein